MKRNERTIFSFLLVLVVLTLVVSMSLSAGHVFSAEPTKTSNTWPMLGFDSARTGHTTVIGPKQNIQKAWNTSLGDWVESSPAIRDGTVYIGSWNGKVYALNASSGEEQWTFLTGDAVQSSPAISSGTVYVGSNDDSIYALNASTGEKRWNFPTGDDVESSPVVADGIVYVGSLDGKVYALNASTGEEQWNFSTGDEVRASPAVSNGMVFIGSLDGKVYALDASTGNEQWNVSTGDWVMAAPAVVNGTVFVGVTDGTLYALSVSDGSIQWKQSLGASIESSPAVANGVVYVGTYDNHIYALDSSNGNQNWKFETGDVIISSLAVADGVVYVGSKDTDIYAVNASTGSKLWNVSTNGWILSSPAVVDGWVYVGSFDTGVYAITETTTAATPTPTQTADSSDGGDGGGGGGQSSTSTPTPTPISSFDTTVEETKTGASVTVIGGQAGQSVHISLPDSASARCGGLETIEIELGNDDLDFQFNLSVLSELPPEAPLLAGRGGFCHFEIAHPNISDTDVSNVKFTFTVNNETINRVGISPDKVAVYRYHEGNWEKLETTYRGGTVYVATSPGFSLFSIGIAGSEFKITDIKSNTTSITTNGSVAITATIENVGTKAGTFTAEFSTNRTFFGEKTVTIPSGKSRTITFVATLNSTGVHEMRVNGESVGTLWVTEAPDENVENRNTPTSQIAPSNRPLTVIGISFLMGASGGVLVIAVIAFLLLLRRRKQA